MPPGLVRQAQGELQGPYRLTATWLCEPRRNLLERPTRRGGQVTNAATGAADPEESVACRPPRAQEQGLHRAQGSRDQPFQGPTQRAALCCTTEPKTVINVAKAREHVHTRAGKNQATRFPRLWEKRIPEA